MRGWLLTDEGVIVATKEVNTDRETRNWIATNEEEGAATEGEVTLL